MAEAQQEALSESVATQLATKVDLGTVRDRIVGDLCRRLCGGKSIGSPTLQPRFCGLHLLSAALWFGGPRLFLGLKA
jgi:hypothetical protein